MNQEISSNDTRQTTSIYIYINIYIYIYTSFGEEVIDLGILGEWSNTSLLLRPEPFRSEIVVIVRIHTMGQIRLYAVHLHLIGILDTT